MQRKQQSKGAAERIYPYAQTPKARMTPSMLHRWWLQLGSKIKQAWKYRRLFLDLLVGVPNYERYVEHMKTRHPGQPVKSRREFFCEAQEARYNGKGGKISRCC